MKDTLGCRVGAIYLKGTSESHVEGHLKGIPFYYWSNRTVRAQNLLNQSHPIQIQKVQIKGSEPARLCWIINMSKRSYSPFHKPLTRRFAVLNTCNQGWSVRIGDYKYSSLRNVELSVCEKGCKQTSVWLTNLFIVANGFHDFSILCASVKSVICSLNECDVSTNISSRWMDVMSLNLCINEIDRTSRGLHPLDDNFAYVDEYPARLAGQTIESRDIIVFHRTHPCRCSSLTF